MQEIKNWSYLGLHSYKNQAKYKLECPFCYKTLLVYAKRFASIGKKCTCGAKLYNSGATVIYKKEE